MQTPQNNIVTTIQVWLPILTVVAGGLVGLYKYVDAQRVEQEKLASARLQEAQQPFLKKQLELYLKTSQVIGNLVSLEPASDDWKSAEVRYWALYWSELSLVEHEVVKTAMQQYAGVLSSFKRAPTEENRRQLENETYSLARALRKGVAASWSALKE